jgi:hypothetical protein
LSPCLIETAVKARVEFAWLITIGAASMFSSAKTVETLKAKQNKPPSSTNERKRGRLLNSDDILVPPPKIYILNDIVNLRTG